MNNAKEIIEWLQEFCGDKYIMKASYQHGKLIFNNKNERISTFDTDLPLTHLESLITKAKCLAEISQDNSAFKDWNKFIIKKLLSENRFNEDVSLLLVHNDSYYADLPAYLELVETVRNLSDEETAIKFFNKIPKNIGRIAYLRSNELVSIFNKIEDCFQEKKEERVLDFLVSKSRKGIISYVYVRDALLEKYGSNKEVLSKFKKVVPLLGNMELNISESFIDEDELLKKEGKQKITSVVVLENISAILKFPNFKNESYALLLNKLLMQYIKSDKNADDFLSSNITLDNKKCLYLTLITRDLNYNKKNLNHMIESFLQDIKGQSDFITNVGLDTDFYKKWLAQYSLGQKLPKTNKIKKETNKI